MPNSKLLRLFLEKESHHTIFRPILGSEKHGSEYEQALARLIVMALTIGALFYLNNSLNLQTYVVIACCSLYSTYLFFDTKFNKAYHHKRVLAAMLLDVSATSISLYVSVEIGTALMGVYLWLVIGYGFRYGKKLLLMTYVTSVIGFIIGSLANGTVYSATFFGLLFSLTAVPLYALSLLTKLQEATLKAEAASRAKGEFLSHISHEIRTPLNGILGASSLIEAKALSETHKPLFNVIQNSSSVLLDLVNDVLDLAAIESGKTKVYKQGFDLDSLITNATSIFDTQASNKNVAINRSISQDTPLKLHGDFMHAKQVLINLVGNAVKFTDQGSVDINVTTISRKDNKAKLRFEVIDTGIGIPETSISKIFESFTQAEDDTRYKFGGTGLGTTISKNLVELMGGHIGVESEPNVGSTFWFELPFELLSKDEAKTLNTSEVISFEKFAGNEKRAYRILVAEDNDTNILIISNMLSVGGHQFDVVKNGHQVLDMLAQHEYDLMILDVNMPEMGGLEALRIYHAMNIGLPVTQAIILSADATEATKVQFEDVNVAAYLTKPVQLNVLLEAIDELGRSLISSDTATISTESKQAFNSTAQVLRFEDARKVSEEVLGSELAVEYLNLDRLNDLVGISTNPEFLTTLIDGFIEDTDEQFVMLSSYIQSGDHINIQATAHAMAGSGLNVGADVFGQSCKRLEATTPNNTQEMLSIYDDVRLAYKQTLQAFKDYSHHQAKPVTTTT